MAEFKRKPNSTWEYATLHTSPSKENFLLLNQMFPASSGMHLSLCAAVRHSCQRAASSCGPGLRNAAKESRSEQNSSLLKATAGSRDSQIFIKFKSSHRVSNITASCESSRPLLRLVVVIPSDLFSPTCWSNTDRAGLLNQSEK